MAKSDIRADLGRASGLTGFLIAASLGACSEAGGGGPGPESARAQDPLAVQVGALDGAARTIPYGGYVDFDGEPVNAGGVKFNFVLFPCATPGPGQCSHLWVARGTWNDAVAWSAGWPTGTSDSVTLPVFSGRFTVELGAAGQHPLPESVFDEAYETLYLGIRIEGSALGALQKVTPAFRSVSSSQADRFRVRSAIELDDPSSSGAATLEAGEGLVVGHSNAALAATASLFRTEHAGVSQFEVTQGAGVWAHGDLHVAGALGVAALVSPPAGCGPDTGRGLLYFDAATGLRACNGAAWVAANGAGQGLAAMPVVPVQYVEFSTVPTPADPATWDPTGRLVAINNGAVWDATEKAYKTSGSSASYIDSRWRPGSFGKTACTWKKYWDAAATTGLDGYQASGAYFYFGNYGPPPIRWYYFSGSSGGYGTNQSPGAPAANTWAFICLASGGAGATTQLYAAVPGDERPVLRHSQIGNGGDAGHLGDSTGMLYGALSSNSEGWSKAFYGGFYHFDVGLSADQVKQVWEATRRYYPGHGGGATR